ncbi:substrate-binding domain-containing protein [Propionimicrobium sp. PCR01-08-3]|uniref:substrate-binding domain-containing protein n=1 Tax=Propionimicrobium sp. PCR01-08-3 TaxID=3052086 RepID=UPI00255C3D39|nr:substrate-binding domain-containing protein [Propionimicrobium sp. PCR01-08-3]WIY83489.1 substrate-binding domain-containing protein [Propionimicrobium sp. PCR01-08-3]
MRHLRTAAVVMASVTALSLTIAGCGRGESSGQGGSATLIVSTLNNPWFVSVVDGAKAQAQTDGITLDVQNANDSDKTALDLMQTAVTKQPDAIMINPVSDDSGTSMTQAGNQADIPVLAFDRKPADGTLASYIGFSNVESGQIAGKQLADAIGGEGEVVELMGTPGLAVSAERSQGFGEAMAEYSGIEIVSQQSGDFDRGKSLNVMTNILQAHPDVAGIFAANDEMALGAIAALDAIGRAGEVPVIGIDGTADAFKAIEAGTMYGTQAEPPFILGQSVVEIAAKVINGEEVDAETQLHGEFVNSETLSGFCTKLSEIGDVTTCEGLA